MKIRFIEATNAGPKGNWGKFMVARFDEEWQIPSEISGMLLAGRGWTPNHILVLDLQTGEGGLFRHGGSAPHDLNKKRIWVCPLFEPFLVWLYAQDDPLEIPSQVELDDAPFEFHGYRRPGPDNDACSWCGSQAPHHHPYCYQNPEHHHAFVDGQCVCGVTESDTDHADPP